MKHLESLWRSPVVILPHCSQRLMLSVVTLKSVTPRSWWVTTFFCDCVKHSIPLVLLTEFHFFLYQCQYYDRDQSRTTGPALELNQVTFLFPVEMHCWHPCVSHPHFNFLFTPTHPRQCNNFLLTLLSWRASFFSLFHPIRLQVLSCCFGNFVWFSDSSEHLLLYYCCLFLVKQLLSTTVCSCMLKICILVLYN